MMCEAEKAQPSLQVLGTVTAKTVRETRFPSVHFSECDLGLPEAGTGPGPQRGLLLGHRFS